MRRLLTRFANIVLFLGIALGLSAQGIGFDWTTLTAPQINGSSRYVGMAGAMVSVGGDASAIKDNPAALGIFRQSELSLSGDFLHNSMRSEEHYRLGKFSMPQLSWIQHFGRENKQRGLLHHSFSVSYMRVGVPYTEFSLSGLSATISDWFPYARKGQAEATQYTGGHVDDYSFAWGMNANNQWYFGLSAALATIDQSTEIHASAVMPEGNKIYLDSLYSMSGLGLRLGAGLIYRPVTSLRLGLSFFSPTWATMKLDRTSCADFQGINYGETIRLPLRTSAGVAYQAGSRGLLSLQYDYQHATQLSVADTHLLKAGGELVLRQHVFLDAGYALRWNDMYHVASLAVSYRGPYWAIGAAYQFGYSQQAYTRITNRLVMTVAWRY